MDLGVGGGDVKNVPDEKMVRDLHGISLEQKEKHFHRLKGYKEGFLEIPLELSVEA